MRLFLSFLIIVTIVVEGFSEDYRLRVRHFTMQNGLPNDFVYWTTQDQDGFIWLATNYGYARFDGYKMEVYNQGKYVDYQPVIYNNARQIFQDVNGKMWITYFRNSDISFNEDRNDNLLEILDPIKKKAVSFNQAFEDIAPFKMSQISLVRGDSDYGIWIVTSTGTIYKYDGHFNKIGKIAPELIYDHISSFNVIAGNEVFWLLDTNTASLYEIKKDAATKVYHVAQPVSSLWVDRQDKLWMTSPDQPKVYHKSVGKSIEVLNLSFQPPLFAEENQVHTVRDSKNRIWLVKRHQVFIYSQEGKLLLQSTFADTKEERNKFVNVTRIHIDKADNVWLCTANGVYMMSLYKSPFINYMIDKGIQDIRGIIVDERNNDIYVNQAFLYKINKKEQIVANFQGIGNIKDDNIIWSGYYAPTVIKYDIRSQKTTQVLADTIIASKRAHVSVPYKSNRTGRIWLGGMEIFGYVEQGKDTIVLFEGYGAFPELKKKNVSWFYENKEGLWLATGGGLYLLDESKNILIDFIEPLANLNILHIYEDKDGVFWLATKGNGLWRWDRKKGTFTAFTQEEGLSNNVIYAVYEDDYGYLWLPSNYGLMRFNKTTHEVNTYLPKDGIPHHEFNYTSHTRTADGRLFFGGLGGVTSLHPKNFLDRTDINFPLRIISLKKLNAKNGNLYDYTEDLLREKQIILGPKERSLALEVALLNYESSEKNRYAYWIEGLEKKWNYVNTNSIWIGQLPYGHYTFHIKAQDANKHWSKQEISIPVWVKRPFYIKWWFLLSLGLALVLFIILAARWRIRELKKTQDYLQTEVLQQTIQIRQQAEKLQALDEQKSRFFLNIAHELRTPLTLISSPIDLFLQKEKVDSKISTFLQSIRKNAKHLLALVESILDLVRLDAKQLELTEQPVHFYSLVKRIFEMYESYAKLHGIYYYFHYFLEESSELLLDVPKFERILHNLLSNAVKFTTTGGEISLQVEESGSNILIQVKDTGVGIDSRELPYVFDRYFQSKSADIAQGGMGMGLNIAQEYAHLMQGSLHVESEANKGSTFYFSFPKKLVAPGTSTSNSETPDNAILDPKKQNGKNKIFTILIVEDNPEIQELLYQIVSPTYQIIQAFNGKTALDILEKQDIHGIITDIMMPQMDGFELIAKVKANARWKKLPIIVITARASEMDKLQALRIGVDDYLYKPFSPEELLTRLRNLLTNYQRRIHLNTNVEVEMLNADQQWLIELENKTLSLLKQNPGFKSSDIAFMMNISEVHLRRKIRTITGLSANDYIKEIRLQCARQLLERKVMSNVADVSYAVGFTKPRYFTELYIARFGKKPSSYLWNEYKES